MNYEKKTPKWYREHLHAGRYKNITAARRALGKFAASWTASALAQARKATDRHFPKPVPRKRAPRRRPSQKRQPPPPHPFMLMPLDECFARCRVIREGCEVILDGERMLRENAPTILQPDGTPFPFRNSGAALAVGPLILSTLEALAARVGVSLSSPH